METLDALAELVRRRSGLFVRWSRGPSGDVAGASSDDLTGEPLPGLSANPLAVEPWWVARRLFDYSHLQHYKRPGVQPWVLQGRAPERGSDNEPLVGCDRPVAWIADQVIDEAVRAVEEHNLQWGRSRLGPDRILDRTDRGGYAPGAGEQSRHHLLTRDLGNPRLCLVLSIRRPTVRCV